MAVGEIILKIIKKMKDWKAVKFLTNTVVLTFIIGIILEIIGLSKILTPYTALIFSNPDLLNSIIKSIGGALIGGGVFTAVIKSTEYTDIFAKVIEDIIWSKEFIKKRGDKIEIWSMVSRLIYQEKFPKISDEIEEIITNNYFPTTHQYYIENNDLVVNITDLDENFWEQNETFSVTVIPTSTETKINYTLGTWIDKPDYDCDDKTSMVIESIIVNLKDVTIEPVTLNNTEKHISYDHFINLHGSQKYDIVIRRKKIICKKTNPDKKFFARTIVKGMRITIISNDTLNYEIISMGTIKKFEKTLDQRNTGTKMVTWSYEGLILPEQGYTIIFK